ncbi:MAG: hypothetical protein AAGE98_20805 [Actinomycetota bacterium]
MAEPSSAQLHVYERRVTSQNGEDGILAALVDAVGTTNRTAVEFGAGVGPTECNSLRLVDEDGWSAVWLDGADQPDDSRVVQAFITAENINDLFAANDVPDHPDLLSVDIDSNDYWVLDAIDERYAPRILVVEYNASLGPTDRLTIAYDPSFVWQVNDYFGASLAALTAAADRKGLALVGCDSLGINAFFVARSALTEFVELTPEQAFVPCGYGIVENGRHVGYRRAERGFEQV